MTRFEELVARIPVVARGVAEETQRRLDAKTKPRGSLGRLESLACRIAAIRWTPVPEIPRKAIIVMAADHGVAEEGVSAYPQAVTGQMLRNFARGGAAINVLARQSGARVEVVDMGVREALPPMPGVRVHRVGPGTKNLALGAAMTREEAIRAIEAGISVAERLAGEGITLFGLGEMGIGNTTAASALVAAFTGRKPEAVTGFGTGIAPEIHRRKVEVIRRALDVNAPDPADPLGVLAKLGGFEIAGLAGVALGGAASRIPVLMDGFITGAAALAAARMAPAAADYFIASHRSTEPGHAVVLEAMGTEPLFDLGLRLGEGTGAALAMAIVEAAIRILHEMATFESAGVSDQEG